MFEARAQESEHLDRPDCDPALAAASYRFMERVNAGFGGTAAVLRFLAAETAGRPPAAPVRILDIGSGSCDIPLAASRWARARALSLAVTCLEPAAHAAALARERLARAADPAVRLLQEDAFSHRPDEPYDLAIASMCFHHFSDAQILALLRRLRGFVRRAVLVNDLRRSPWASLGAGLLLAVTGAPAGVRHDALLSIRRGFTVAGLRSLLERVEGAAVCVEPARGFRVAAVIRFNTGADT